MIGEIWKFEITRDITTEIDVPGNYKILKVDYQNGHMCIWIMVESGKPKTRITIEVHGTGFKINDCENLEHIDTLQQDYFVWHIFERRKK